jgi:hypothetical protein
MRFGLAKAEATRANCRKTSSLNSLARMLFFLK